MRLCSTNCCCCYCCCSWPSECSKGQSCSFGRLERRRQVFEPIMLPTRSHSSLASHPASHLAAYCFAVNKRAKGAGHACNAANLVALYLVACPPQRRRLEGIAQHSLHPWAGSDWTSESNLTNFFFVLCRKKGLTVCYLRERRVSLLQVLGVGLSGRLSAHYGRIGFRTPSFGC